MGKDKDQGQQTANLKFSTDLKVRKSVQHLKIRGEIKLF